MSRPLSISVITPSLNQATTIDETIRSVRDQDYPHFEHFVIDGGSQDATVDILERHRDLLWVSERDQGQTDAINKGLKRAGGDVVAYLNSDDCYRPGTFRAVAEAFADPGCCVLVGNCDVIDADSKTRDVYQARLDAREDLLRWWKWNNGFCIPQPAVFIRRSALDAVGPFDPSYHLAMDLEMWMRLAKVFPFTLTQRTLAAFRITPETKTSRRRREMVLECDRAARTHIDLADPADRAGLTHELDLEAAGHLLTIAEEQGDRAVLREAFRFSAAVAASSRFWRALVAPKPRATA